MKLFLFCSSDKSYSIVNKLANLDNKHVVFGRVADDESKLIVDRLGEVFTNSNDYPIVKCEIANSGLLSEIN